MVPTMAMSAPPMALYLATSLGWRVNLLRSKSVLTDFSIDCDGSKGVGHVPQHHRRHDHRHQEQRIEHHDTLATDHTLRCRTVCSDWTHCARRAFRDRLAAGADLAAVDFAAVDLARRDRQARPDPHPEHPGNHDRTSRTTPTRSGRSHQPPPPRRLLAPTHGVGPPGWSGHPGVAVRAADPAAGGGDRPGRARPVRHGLPRGRPVHGCGRYPLRSPPAPNRYESQNGHRPTGWPRSTPSAAAGSQGRRVIGGPGPAEPTPTGEPRRSTVGWPRVGDSSARGAGRPSSEPYSAGIGEPHPVPRLPAPGPTRSAVCRRRAGLIGHSVAFLHGQHGSDRGHRPAPESSETTRTPVASRPWLDISRTAIRTITPAEEVTRISSSSPTMKAETTRPRCAVSLMPRTPRPPRPCRLK